jgi:ribosomal protein S18 acetylase RimI-like enzyme
MICIATEQDAEQIHRVTDSTGMFNAEEVQCVVEIFQEYIHLGVETSGYTFLVEKEGERVLGFICVGPRSLTDRVYDLYWIAVAPSAQRLGVGGRLLKRAEEAVREKGGRLLAIETSGTEKYSGTRAFYQSVGYLHEATLHDLYSDGDDLWIYTKRLQPRQDVK